MHIKFVRTPEEIEQIRNLFREYAASLEFDLEFQDFAEELQTLPGSYARPEGELFLCEEDGVSIGCAALRRIDPDICELKRMYLKPEWRGKGLGKVIAFEVIKHAQELGYKKIRLDTIATMKEAIALYEKIGFKEIAPYRYNPIKGAKFMELII